MKSKPALITIIAALVATGTTQAGEIGHFAPGVMNIRDYVVPEPGLYGLVYNYWYSTDQLNDRNGNQVRTITVGPGAGISLAADVDVDLYAVAPTFIWVSDEKLLGARYAAYIAPSFASSSVGASLSTASGRGLSSDSSEFDLGDLFVQPLWLGWAQKHWDFALGYGFYAPVGKYGTETVTLPGPGSFKTESADNIGLGFWTNQIQGAATWYPWEDKRMAVSTALTWEIHGDKKGFDVTPGQNLTFNWGISQYLPLNKDQSLLMELGPAGYSSWQITDDSGSDAKNPGVHDEVHAAGFQLGLTNVPKMLSLNLHYFYEYSATARFQGESFGLTIGKKF